MSSKYQPRFTLLSSILSLRNKNILFWHLLISSQAVFCFQGEGKVSQAKTEVATALFQSQIIVLSNSKLAPRIIFVSCQEEKSYNDLTFGIWIIEDE